MLLHFLVSQLCLYLGNSQVSVYRTIGPLVLNFHHNFNSPLTSILTSIFNSSITSINSGQLLILRLFFLHFHNNFNSSTPPPKEDPTPTFFFHFAFSQLQFFVRIHSDLHPTIGLDPLNFFFAIFHVTVTSILCSYPP